MTPDERFAEDPVLARVSAARPALAEADLSPVGERATAILDRVLAAPRDEPTRRDRAPRRRWLRWPTGFGVLAVAAVTAALVFVVVGLGGGTKSRLPALGTHPLPTSDVVHLDSTAHLTPGQLRLADRTPLGRAIAQQYLRTQENIDTGTTRAQNERALQQLQFNQAACLHAAAVVAAAPVTAAQRFLQYDWVHGIRQQAQMDGLFITAIRELAAGHRTAGERAFNAAGDLSNASDAFTAYPLDWLTGNKLPLPHTPGIEGPNATRRAG